MRTYSGHANTKYCIPALFLDGDYIVGGGDAGDIWVWAVGSKKVLGVIENAHAGGVIGLDVRRLKGFDSGLSNEWVIASCGVMRNEPIKIFHINKNSFAKGGVVDGRI